MNHTSGKPRRRVFAAKVPNLGAVALLGADECKQEILKFANRGAKSAKRFAIIAAELKYDLAEENSTIETVASALAQVCRDGDRLCMLSPYHVLAIQLEPTSNSASAIESSISNAFSTTMRDAVLLRCAVVDLDGNLGVALEAVGCEIDEHGDLVPTRPPLTASNIGSKSRWLARFTLGKTLTAENAEVQARIASDQWTGRKVVLFQFTQDEGLREEEQNRLLRTAHALIKIDHPLIDTITDYYLDVSNSFLWTGTYIEEASLTEHLKCKKISESVFLEWMDGLLSALIYLQGLVPHPVLPRLNDIYVSNDRSIRIAVWEPDCLLNPISGSGTSRALVSEFSLLCLKFLESNSRLSSVTALVQESLEEPSQLTLHRLRAAIKKIAESQNA